MSTPTPTPELQPLRERVKSIMPILNANLSAAHDEWMSGKIARGAFEYCLSRHATALELLSGENFDIETAYRACAPLTIDIRSGLKDTNDNGKTEEVMAAWIECFRNAGFTEMHRLYNIPIRPVEPVIA